jgi:CubicO group peptidase (beta-lactamase class C family)
LPGLAVAASSVLVLTLLPVGGQTGGIDDLILKEMRDRKISGLSLAVIRNGRIVSARGFGFADRDRKIPVTPETLFQAGSISKPVAAVGALHLVERGRLSLDTDVNATLRSWKVPESRFTGTRKVTLRGILSHSAGLTIHGFAGYAADDAMPTLVQILKGAKPANTGPVRVDRTPGEEWRYSGGGYTVMQQLMIDATGLPFEQFMRDAVLQPFGMTRSTYDQTAAEIAGTAATGHGSNGRAVQGNWRRHPEMAAAGLWTTPSDLARFATALQQALGGTANPVISQDMTREMLSRIKDNSGLGLFLRDNGEALTFYHAGRNAGFDSFMVASARGGTGAVIMINKNDDSSILERIAKAIAGADGWVGYR